MSVDLAGILGDAWRALKVSRCRVWWGMTGVSPPQPSRGSSGASWGPPAKFGAQPWPETDFCVFWKPQNSSFCTYMIKSGETICISVPHSKLCGDLSPVINAHEHNWPWPLTLGANTDGSAQVRAHLRLSMLICLFIHVLLPYRQNAVDNFYQLQRTELKKRNLRSWKWTRSGAVVCLELTWKDDVFVPADVDSVHDQTASGTDERPSASVVPRDLRVVDRGRRGLRQFLRSAQTRFVTDGMTRRHLVFVVFSANRGLRQSVDNSLCDRSTILTPLLLLPGFQAKCISKHWRDVVASLQFRRVSVVQRK